MQDMQTIRVTFGRDGLPIIEVDDIARLHFEGRTGGQLRLTGNREGLRLLAKALLGVAECKAPEGFHVHLDELYNLDNDGGEIIIERDEGPKVNGTGS